MFVTGKIATIFISLSAVHTYDFHTYLLSFVVDHFTFSEHFQCFPFQLMQVMKLNILLSFLRNFVSRLLLVSSTIFAPPVFLLAEHVCDAGTLHNT